MNTEHWEKIKGPIYVSNKILCFFSNITGYLLNWDKILEKQYDLMFNGITTKNIIMDLFTLYYFDVMKQYGYFKKEDILIKCFEGEISSLPERMKYKHLRNIVYPNVSEIDFKLSENAKKRIMESGNCF